MIEECAVLIPCYNEAASIRKVVNDFRRIMPDAVIFVYDNNSSDGTAEIAAEAGAIVRRERRQGKGNVVRSMFRDIDAKCYIMVDGDDTYPAEDAREMARKVLEDGADMVVGDRLSSTYYTENKRPFHNLGNSLVRKAVNILFHADIKDIMTGYRAFSYDFVKTYAVVSGGFEIETEMSIHAIDKGMAVANHTISYRDRAEGSESKLNTYSDGFKVLMTIFRLFRLYRPMMFFGMLALVLLLLAMVFFIPVLSTYIHTGEVPHYPTLIVCGFTVLAAMHSFFAGLMLHLSTMKNRQDFEDRLKQVRMLKGITERLNNLVENDWAK